MKKILYSLTFLFVLQLSVFAQEDDEWYGFDYKEAGISNTEFELVKERGMSRKELEMLLEYGIMPSEYYSEPWKKLGVSKTEWLNSKKAGMEDDDMDRRVYTQSKFNYMPIVSFVLPGFYQFKTDRYKFGGALSGIAATSLLLTFLHQEETQSSTEADPEYSIYPIYPIIVLLCMGTSAVDAYLGTRYHDNQGAARFSFNLSPNLEPSALFSLDF